MSDAKPYTFEAIQELADDGVHLLNIDDAGVLATIRALDAANARIAELERWWVDSVNNEASMAGELAAMRIRVAEMVAERRHE